VPSSIDLLIYLTKPSSHPGSMRCQNAPQTEQIAVANITYESSDKRKNFHATL
jgi:hypothetical protein